MTHKGKKPPERSKTPSTKVLSKKELVLGDRERKKTGPIVFALSAVIIASLAVIIWKPWDNQAQLVERIQETTSKETVLSYPLESISDGKAHHFSYADGDRSIRFFLLKSSDGVIRTAFDACDVCFPDGMGYSQSGDAMVCNKCGRLFESIRINEVKGGCNPAPLNRRVENGVVLVEVSDILQGARYFSAVDRG